MTIHNLINEINQSNCTDIKVKRHKVMHGNGGAGDYKTLTLEFAGTTIIFNETDDGWEAVSPAPLP